MYNQKEIRPISDAATIAWLAAILEGEGSFILCKGRISISLTMTDKDVVERVCTLIDAPCITLKARHVQHKESYVCRVTGVRAAYYMQLVLPFMSARRSSKIEECLAHFKATVESRRGMTAQRSQMVTDTTLKDAWLKRDPAQSFRKFAKSIGLTARDSGKQRLMRFGLIQGTSPSVRRLQPVPVVLSFDESNRLGWIAGLLEGEGCFTYSGRSICITLEMTDEDVIQRFCEFTESGYRMIPRRQQHWKDTYLVKLSGERAAKWLTHILPYMGERRTEKIRERLSVHAGITARKEGRDAIRSARLPLDAFKSRWENRQPGESLLKISREFGVHPQSLKSQLLKMGIYESPQQRHAA